MKVKSLRLKNFRNYGEEEFVFDGSASVKYYNNIVNVSGSVDSSYAGTKATLILILQSSYTDLSTAEYINECKIAADGSYQFKFKSDAVNTSDEDYVFIVKTEQDGITKNRVLARNDEELVTLSGVYDVSTGVTASIKNNFLDEKNTYVIIASYDENKAVKEVKYVPFNMAFGENGEIQSTALTVTDPGTQIKVFLWENFTTLKPIATEFLIDEIPEPETEETAGVSEE